MWAWVTSTPSTRRGSKGRFALSSCASNRRPWNRPASSRIRAPAASSRCIEPVTCPAAPQNVSLRPGIGMRYRAPVGSSGAEEAVAGVAEAGQDESLLVELAIECGGEDRNIRVRLGHRPDAFGRGHDGEEPDAPGAGLLERCDRGDGRAAG